MRLINGGLPLLFVAELVEFPEFACRPASAGRFEGTPQQRKASARFRIQMCGTEGRKCACHVIGSVYEHALLRLVVRLKLCEVRNRAPKLGYDWWFTHRGMPREQRKTNVWGDLKSSIAPNAPETAWSCSTPNCASFSPLRPLRSA